MSACSESQSTIFPLPSSPHWEPTTTTLAMRCPSVAWPEIIPNQQRFAQAPDPPGINGSCRLSQGGGRAKPRPWPGRYTVQPPLPLLGLVSKPDEWALQKAISRRYRGEVREVLASLTPSGRAFCLGDRRSSGVGAPGHGGTVSLGN